MKIKIILIGLLVVWVLGLANAQEQGYVLKNDVPYYSETKQAKDTYLREQCVLDVYHPEGEKGFATLVWFHGGGLTGGVKEIPGGLREKGICVVAVNYRLYPKVKAPVYIEDAAAAVAWVFDHIEEFGGDSSQIFVSGHSAGGYLASMIGLDKQYLAIHGIDANRIAGLLPLSGHTITHFSIRNELGIPGTQPVVDAFAPLYHVRSDASPMVLITGDRELELLGRYEENAYFLRMMRVIGHKNTILYELQGYDHGMVEPALPIVLKEMKRIVGQRE